MRQKTYCKSYKVLMNKFKAHTDGMIHHVLGLEESILWKWPYYPKQSTDSMQSLSKDQWHFWQNWNKYKKPVWKHNVMWWPFIAKLILRKRNRAKGIRFPDFRLYKVYSHQNCMVLEQKQRHRLMELDRKPRNKPMYLWVINL